MTTKGKKQKGEEVYEEKKMEDDDSFNTRKKWRNMIPRKNERTRRMI